MKLETLFTRLAAFSVRRPRAVLATTAALVLLALGIAASRLELRTSNLDLVDPELPTVRHFLDFAAEFGTPNVLVVVFEGDDPAVLAAAVDRAGARLRTAPGVRTVIDRLPFEPDALEILGADPYLRSRDGKMAFLFVQPDDPRSSAETIAPFVTGVRQALAEVATPGVRAGLTGIPQYALDDRDVIQRDISVLSLVSLGLIFALFVGAFGALRRPLLAVVALLAGLGVTLGLLTLYPGHLTLLSAFFASTLLGLGIDYGIHTIDRVEELIASGVSEAEALPRALGSLAWGLTTGALTTATALFSLVFSGFKGFAELGVIAGAGILVCLATMVVVLPALLVVWKPGRGRRIREHKLSERRIGRVLAALQGRPLAWGLAALALASLWVGGPGFDTDYLDLQPKDSEAVRLEREMVRRSSWSPQFAVFIAKGREEVKELGWQLINEDTVASVRSVRDFELLPGLPGAGPELSAAFRSSLESPRGRFAVYAYPNADVWKPEEQARFVTAMKAIDPEVTGMPILGSFMVDLSKRAFDVATTLGAALLLFWVWLDFRKPLLILLAALPTVLTAISLHPLLRLLDIPWNPLNVMALPIVLGIAVDNGVHLVHRFRAERGDLVRTLAGTGRSVVMTSATTVASFGTLVLTSHRGLASFALALSLGVMLALVFSVLVLPELLKIFKGRIVEIEIGSATPLNRLPRGFLFRAGRSRLPSRFLP